MGGQDSGVLIGDRGIREPAARYDAWFATPLRQALDGAAAQGCSSFDANGPGEHVLDADWDTSYEPRGGR